MDLSSKQLAILASAYNVCGPRAGNPARPSTVLSMASVEQLKSYEQPYLAHVRADQDALYTTAEVSDAFKAL